MTIYLDVVFIENICMNMIILYATGIVTKSKFKALRILMASIIGAMYAIRYIFDKQLYILKSSIKDNIITCNGIYSISS